MIFMLSNPDVSAFFYHPWYNIQAIKYNRQKGSNSSNLGLFGPIRRSYPPPPPHTPFPPGHAMARRRAKVMKKLVLALRTCIIIYLAAACANASQQPEKDTEQNLFLDLTG